ncbi:Aspartokinase [Zea mays]|nr:Aspartokinase [Zea mays]
MSSANDASACPIRLWHRNLILDSIEGLQCRHRHSWKSSTDGHRAPRWAVLSTAARTACVGAILTPAPTSAPATQHADDTSSSL